MGTYFDVGDVSYYCCQQHPKYVIINWAFVTTISWLFSKNRDNKTFLGKSLKSVIAVGLLDVFVQCQIKFKKLQVHSPEKSIRILVSWMPIWEAPMIKSKMTGRRKLRIWGEVKFFWKSNFFRQVKFFWKFLQWFSDGEKRKFWIQQEKIWWRENAWNAIIEHQNVTRQDDEHHLWHQHFMKIMKHQKHSVSLVF